MYNRDADFILHQLKTINFAAFIVLPSLLSSTRLQLVMSLSAIIASVFFSNIVSNATKSCLDVAT